MASNPSSPSIDEELKILETKLKQLKLDYDHYFLGTRPREPAMARAEIHKIILRHSNTPIQNTAARFKFNSINARYQALKRQWDVTLRQIEAGTYTRHVFKANLHERERERAGGGEARSPAQSGGASDADLFENYRDAALACGQNVKGLTPAKLKAEVAKQEAALKKKLGCEKVAFRVVVEGGKVKLKASTNR
ncbi:MAG: hypothetical protein JRG92_15180 [Deltaproteobacteria bacterium]|nr:hypothetical protein [Deltaproteobacteria bacterium]MBW2698084.1 hypothetical protein [Deltaproteobacteria bacterium]